MFENALVAGILSMGVNVHLVGPLPTPAIAFLTRSMRADAGIVISASHNPFQDNGIKIFGADGFKLPDSLEAEVERYALGAVAGENSAPRPSAQHIGKASRIDDAPGRYIVFLKNAFPQELNLEGLSIAVDCAHGAGYRVAPAVFSELGADLVVLGDTSPTAPTSTPGWAPCIPRVSRKVVASGRAQVGIALDGDGDPAHHGG